MTNVAFNSPNVSVANCFICDSKTSSDLNLLSYICPAQAQSRAHGFTPLCHDCFNKIEETDDKCPLCRAYFLESGQAVFPEARVTQTSSSNSSSSSMRHSSHQGGESKHRKSRSIFSRRS